MTANADIRSDVWWLVVVGPVLYSGYKLGGTEALDGLPLPVGRGRREGPSSMEMQKTLIFIPPLVCMNVLLFRTILLAFLLPRSSSFLRRTRMFPSAASETRHFGTLPFVSFVAEQCSVICEQERGNGPFVPPASVA